MGGYCPVKYIFSQPSIYIDGWLYCMRMMSSGGARNFFLGGLGPFPLPSLSSLPSLSPPQPFPSLPLLFPFLPFPSPQNEEADRSSAPPLPSPPLLSPPLPACPLLFLPLEVGPLNPARGSGGAL